MISFSHVSARYPKSESPVLTDFNLSFEKGEIVVLLGGSGTGKSTIFRLLTGELEPSEGEIRVRETSLRGLGGNELARYRQSIGLLSHDVKLIEDRTLSENLLLPLEIGGMKKARREEHLTSVLGRFELPALRNVRPDKLSMSERQRAAIARAVITEPFVLLADEPAAHLDAHAAHDIANLLLHENLRGMTVLIATHDELFTSWFRDARIVKL